MFARTRRLLLRPGWIEDAPALAAAIGDRAVVGNLAQVPFPYTVADARSYLAAPAGALPRLLIFLVGGDVPTLVGGIGLDYDKTDAIELGYWIARDRWGQGIATEAGRAMLDIADVALGLQVLKAGHFAENPASGAVLGKLGFRPTGEVSRRYSLARGAIVRCVEFVRDRSLPLPHALAA